MDKKPFRYWTYDRCKEEALKYKTKTEFKINSNGAYHASHKNKWIDDVCNHMVKVINSRNYWTFEMCKVEADKYNDRCEFQYNSGSAYVRARVNGWLDEICSHMNKPSSKPISEYTKDECNVEAKKYKTRKEFYSNSWSYYEASKRSGWLDEICNEYEHRKSGYWNDKEICIHEANKYNTRKEFQHNSGSAYASALRNNWIDEICEHMQIIGNLKKRCIYAYVFTDKSIYIGLTYSLKDRIISRNKNNKDSVMQYILKTNLIPEILQLTDYIDVNEASILEEMYRIKYINEGWNVLNRVKCGATGGDNLIWTYDKVKEVAKKCETKKEFNIKYKGAYIVACKNKWIDDVCEHMILLVKPKDYWTYKRILEIAINCESYKEFRIKFAHIYKIACKNGFISDIRKEINKITEQNED